MEPPKLARKLSSGRLATRKHYSRGDQKIQNPKGFPHQTEDTQLTDTFEILEQIAEPALYADLAPLADASIDELFTTNVQEGKYVIDGTICRSLGSVVVNAITTESHMDDFGKVRLLFKDSRGHCYKLPITDWRVVNDQANGLIEFRRRIRGAKKQNAQMLLRIGLARGFDCKGAWNQKRCYLQVNGIIFPN